MMLRGQEVSTRFKGVVGRQHVCPAVSQRGAIANKDAHGGQRRGEGGVEGRERGGGMRSRHSSCLGQ